MQLSKGLAVQLPHQAECYCRAKQQGLLEGRKAPMQLTQRAASRSQGFGLPGFTAGELLLPPHCPLASVPSSFSGRHVFPPASPRQGAHRDLSARSHTSECTADTSPVPSDALKQLSVSAHTRPHPTCPSSFLACRLLEALG